MAEDCIFCAIVAGEAPAHRIDSDERTISFLDINPATRGHALVIPRRHSTDLFEIEHEDLEATITAARRVAEKLRGALEPEGVNLLNACGTAAWQTVFHFHLHVVPRWHDDPLELPWVPRGAEPAELEQVAGIVNAFEDGGEG